MRTVFSRIPVLAALALSLLAAAPAWAEDKNPPPPPSNPDVVRMEIYNGPLRTVAYFSRNLSPGEASALRELAQAENEQTVADHLLALRAQYVVDEEALEAKRRNMQMLLYGYNADITTSAYAEAGPGWGYPWWGGYGGYYGRGGYAAAGYSADINHTLAVGVGDEGVMKNTLARVVPTSALPDLAAAANRHLDTALARIGSSEKLSDALAKVAPSYSGLALAKGGPEWKPIAKPGEPVYIVRSLDGKTERIEGTLVRQDPDWIVIQTKEGERTLSLWKDSGIREMGPLKK
jgi:hypothetical protein